MSDISPQAFFSDLVPEIVWKHFATLCEIPRASKQEARLRGHLEDWAVTRGLSATVDAAGNLLIRKPASVGREHLPGVILQAHLDMVCQNNADTPHDFSRDPIWPVRRRPHDPRLGALQRDRRAAAAQSVGGAPPGARSAVHRRRRWGRMTSRDIE